MSPEAHKPDTGTPPAADNVVAPPAPAPGLIAGVCSIVAAVVGFGIPVLGMIAACVGIWLGVRGFRQGRVVNYTPSIICGIIGISVACLCIAFWVSVILFESYR